MAMWMRFAHLLLTCDLMMRDLVMRELVMRDLSVRVQWCH
jgi:hypothetical protein